MNALIVKAVFICCIATVLIGISRATYFRLKKTP